MSDVAQMVPAIGQWLLAGGVLSTSALVLRKLGQVQGSIEAAAADRRAQRERSDRHSDTIGKQGDDIGELGVILLRLSDVPKTQKEILRRLREVESSIASLSATVRAQHERSNESRSASRSAGRENSEATSSS